MAFLLSKLWFAALMGSFSGHILIVKIAWLEWGVFCQKYKSISDELILKYGDTYRIQDVSKNGWVDAINKLKNKCVPSMLRVVFYTQWYN